jgi:transposase
MGQQAFALLSTLDTECRNADQLIAAAAEAFQQHPNYEIITSFPSLADLTGARLLAEIGDDRTRFADACALKAYPGSAPVTRASGRSLIVTRRVVKSDRLNAVGYVWAFPSASSTTAWRPVRPTTPSKPSEHQPPNRTKPPLDSQQDRRSA